MPTFKFPDPPQEVACENCPVVEKNEACKFQVVVSWDEAEDSGWIYAKNFVFEMQPSVDSKSCAAFYGTGDGKFELTPKGGAVIKLTASNCWDQMSHAIDPTDTKYTADSPGGIDVQYRVNSKTPDPTKKSGEPYKFSFNKDLLEAIHIHVAHKLLCECKAEDDLGKKGSKSGTLKVDVDFDKKEKPKPKCFIATAAYGATDAPDVEILCRFRDDILRKSPFGRTLIAAYNRVSPPFARAIAPRPNLRAVVRVLIVRPVARLVARASRAP